MVGAKGKVFGFKSRLVFQPLSKKEMGKNNNGFHLDVKVGGEFDSKAKGGEQIVGWNREQEVTEESSK